MHSFIENPSLGLYLPHYSEFARKKQARRRTAADVFARYEDGILKISLPKRVQAELPRSTAIAIE